MDDQTQGAKPRKTATAGDDKKPTPRARSLKAAAKKIAWTFPRINLEDAISIPKAIEKKNAGNPIPAGMLAVAVGFKQAADWRFLDLERIPVTFEHSLHDERSFCILAG